MMDGTDGLQSYGGAVCPFLYPDAWVMVPSVQLPAGQETEGIRGVFR